MPVKVSFKFNTAQTVMKVEGAAKRAIAETAQKVLDDCNEYVPNEQDGLVGATSGSDIPNTCWFGTYPMRGIYITVF